MVPCDCNHGISSEEKKKNTSQKIRTAYNVYFISALYNYIRNQITTGGTSFNFDREIHCVLSHHQVPVFEGVKK